MAKTDQELSSLANIYIIGMNPGYTFEDLKGMAAGNPNWIYALPADASTLNSIKGLSRSTKILVGEENLILKGTNLVIGNFLNGLKYFRR